MKSDKQFEPFLFDPDEDFGANPVAAAYAIQRDANGRARRPQYPLSGD